MLIIPGNHDVNIVDRANPARLELPISPGGALRRMRFLAPMARLQGHRVHVMEPGARRIGPTLNAWLAQEERAAALAAFMDDGGLRAGIVARRCWNDAFPLIVPPPTPDGLGVVLLDPDDERSKRLVEAHRRNSAGTPVLVRGSGSVLGDLPGGPVLAKTGTAEFGDTPPLPKHA